MSILANSTFLIKDREKNLSDNFENGLSTMKLYTKEQLLFYFIK